MPGREETVALIALMRIGNWPAAQLASEVDDAGSARAVLERELDPTGADGRLFGPEPRPPDDLRQALADAAHDLERWQASGIAVRTVLNPGFPPNLRTAHDRPPLLFTLGADSLIAQTRAIAVVGARDASPAGLQLAGDISARLAALEYVVVSGLASGIDAAAHHAALAARGRTIAVIGTGLDRVYPPEHAALQAAIAEHGAVLSRFWPTSPPRREHFPLRNALMSGLTRASIIVEAGPRSGTRIQARAALAQGRPVFLHASLLEQAWARELAGTPNVHAIAGADEAVAVLERRYEPEPLTA